ncbi:MAG: hypothetical protein FWE19_01310 [Oscillospiraceae bacterium]|nr:hypothetical protein [Oscillospiraceae bacterium]
MRKLVGFVVKERIPGVPAYCRKKPIQDLSAVVGILNGLFFCREVL